MNPGRAIPQSHRSLLNLTRRLRKTYQSVGSEIPYEMLDLEQPRASFDIHHDLTTRGIQKFVTDYRATLLKLNSMSAKCRQSR